MAIVTKVPLCGYYFPDDDEIVWLFATVFAYPVNDTGVSNSGVILAATSGKKYLLAHTFVLKTVLKQVGIKHCLACHFHA
ncbi:hypothetical protein JFY74_04295 [Pectobacterium carotovorum]|nr:hypothetical protein JFY74_04295 [Pectobacterium carotovorum]